MQAGMVAIANPADEYPFTQISDAAYSRSGICPNPPDAAVGVLGRPAQ